MRLGGIQRSIRRELDQLQDPFVWMQRLNFVLLKRGARISLVYVASFTSASVGMKEVSGAAVHMAKDLNRHLDRSNRIPVK